MTEWIELQYHLVNVNGRFTDSSRQPPVALFHLLMKLGAVKRFSPTLNTRVDPFDDIRTYTLQVELYGKSRQRSNRLGALPQECASYVS